jgi:hypothetical protein
MINYIISFLKSMKSAINPIFSFFPMVFGAIHTLSLVGTKKFLVIMIYVWTLFLTYENGNNTIPPSKFSC